MRNNYANLTPLPDGNLQFSFSYNPGLITALKLEVPYADRTWQPDKKVWIVTPKHAAKLVELVAQYIGLQMTLPILSTKTSKLETKILKIEYLGAAKDRGNGEITATGYCEKSWSVIFSLEVLKAWFDPDNKGKPTETMTLYSILGLSQKVTQEEIKKAFWRLAKQWHPDVCKEPDATEQFKKLSYAYNVLNDPTTRKKYNAGLKLETSLTTKQPGIDWARGVIIKDEIYRAPLRCGYVLAEGTQVLNRFVVNKVLGWEDVTNDQGLTMVTSWPNGSDFFITEWI